MYVNSRSRLAWSPGHRKHIFESLAVGIVHEKLDFSLLLGAIINSVHCRLSCSVSPLVQIKAKAKRKAGYSDQLCCQVLRPS